MQGSEALSCVPRYLSMWIKNETPHFKFALFKQNVLDLSAVSLLQLRMNLFVLKEATIMNTLYVKLSSL